MKGRRLRWGNVVGRCLAPCLFLFSPLFNSHCLFALFSARESVHRLGRTVLLSFSPRAFYMSPLAAPTRKTLANCTASLLLLQKWFLNETAYILYCILSKILTVSNYRLLLCCHQNTDGSLPANETGDRISTVLFYVRTKTAFMCKKSMMPVRGI